MVCFPVTITGGKEDIEESYPGTEDPDYHPYDNRADIKPEREKPPVGRLPRDKPYSSYKPYTSADYKRDYPGPEDDQLDEIREAVRRALKASIKKA